MRSIGVVRGEGSNEVGLAGEAEEVHTFVIDVGQTSARRALDKAVEDIGKRQWEILGEKQPSMVSMKSTRWDAHLTVTPFYPIYLEHHPEILQTIQGESVKKEGLVIVKIDVYQAG
ncbi:hypothetical protein [Nonomuraea sp. NPDC003201]